MEQPRLTCSICHKPIPVIDKWAEGNNAQPINTGRCCYVCDNEIVTPLRVKLLFEPAARQEPFDGRR